MSGVTIGVGLIVVGFLIAVSGEYLFYVTSAVALIFGLYMSFTQESVLGPVVRDADLSIAQQVYNFIDSIPLLLEIIEGIALGWTLMYLILVSIGILGALLPIIHGLRFGITHFGESLPALVPAALALGISLGVLSVAHFSIPAVMGGILVGVGIQFTFSVTDGSIDPFPEIAEWFRSDTFPDAVPDGIYAVGSVFDSLLLLGVTIFVAITGFCVRVFVYKFIQRKELPWTRLDKFVDSLSNRVNKDW